MTASPLVDRLYTYDDLADLPDDGMRYEIIGGELIVSPAPLLIHQQVLGNLHLAIGGYVRARSLGRVYMAPADVKLSPYDTVEPDLFFVATANLHLLEPKAVSGAPDLTIEILSPSNRRLDLIRKQALYATNGVPEYWIVDPVNRKVDLLKLSGGHYRPIPIEGDLISSRVLPEFRMTLSAVFD